MGSWAGLAVVELGIAVPTLPLPSLFRRLVVVIWLGGPGIRPRCAGDLQRVRPHWLHGGCAGRGMVCVRVLVMLPAWLRRVLVVTVPARALHTLPKRRRHWSTLLVSPMSMRAPSPSDQPA